MVKVVDLESRQVIIISNWATFPENTCCVHFIIKLNSHSALTAGTCHSKINNRNHNITTQRVDFITLLEIDSLDNGQIPDNITNKLEILF